MAEINWNQPAETIHNQVRAFSPRPGAWTQVEVNGQKKRLKIFKSSVVDESGDRGSTLSFTKSEWIIHCQKGALSLLEVQLEGKKRLSISKFNLAFQMPPKLKC